MCSPTQTKYSKTVQIFVIPKSKKVRVKPYCATSRQKNGATFSNVDPRDNKGKFLAVILGYTEGTTESIDV
jgi:hypothetical protein